MSLLWRELRRRLKETAVAVVPITLFLVVFQVGVLRLPIDGVPSVLLGLILVFLGLMFFIQGLRLGLMPLAEGVGYLLPQRSNLMTILIFAVLLGYGATLAEPAIGALKEAAGRSDSPALSNPLLVHVVGVGVGLAVVAGILRLLFSWSLLWLLLPTVVVVAVLSLLAPQSYVEVAWDSGGVTTGPVTVPLVLALGLGVAQVGGRGDLGMAGFGVIALASLFPIGAVLLLGIISTA